MDRPRSLLMSLSSSSILYLPTLSSSNTVHGRERDGGDASYEKFAKKHHQDVRLGW